MTKDSLDDYNLQGPVKQVLYSMYDATLVRDSFSLNTRINSSAWPSKLTFNENGFLLVRSFCNMYDEECRHWIHEYDSSGTLVSQQEIEKDTVVWDKKEYVYSENGDLKSTTQHIREREGLKLAHEIKFTLDDKGRIVIQQKYDENGTFKHESIYEYNENRTLWHSYVQIDDDGNVGKSEKRTFDNEGRIIQEILMADGIVLEKKTSQYAEDSLIALENHVFVDGKLELRDAKHVSYGANGKSIFNIENQNGEMDTARYVWEIRNASGALTYKQRCKHGVLTSENIYKRDSLGRVVIKQRVDHEKGIETRSNYEYNEAGRLTAEFEVSESGNEVSSKRYYDEHENWIYILQSIYADGVEMTHVHKRVIEYFK